MSVEEANPIFSNVENQTGRGSDHYKNIFRENPTATACFFFFCHCSIITHENLYSLMQTETMEDKSGFVQKLEDIASLWETRSLQLKPQSTEDQQPEPPMIHSISSQNVELHGPGM